MIAPLAILATIRASFTSSGRLSASMVRNPTHPLARAAEKTCGRASITQFNGALDGRGDIAMIRNNSNHECAWAATMSAKGGETGANGPSKLTGSTTHAHSVIR